MPSTRRSSSMGGGGEEGMFGFGTALCFTLNCIMGTGFLTLPWAFARTGFLLSIVTLAFTCLLGNAAKDFILEVMARAEYLLPRKAALSGLDSDVLTASVSGEDGREPLLLPSTEEAGLSSDLAAEEDEVTAVVGKRKIEFSQLCDLFLGPGGKRAYTGCLGVFTYGALWAYASVFSSALAEDLPISGVAAHLNYYVYLAIFAAFAVPLTCLELKDQVAVQIFLSLCRLLMVLCMVGTTAAAYHADYPAFGQQAPNADGSYGAAGIPMAVPGHLYEFLPIAIYAFIFHHAIPSLSQPVKDKSQLGRIYLATFAIAAVFYCSIGAVVSWYFGEATLPSSNLNWRHYQGSPSMHKGLVQAIKHFVVLFPALDVSSAFPLNGITLGNGLMSTYYGAEVWMAERDTKKRLGFRLLAALPPLLGAALVHDLGTITNYTGIIGFLIAFVFPALLQARSRVVALETVGDDLKTVYSNVFTMPWVTPVLFVLGLGFVVYALVLNIFTASQH